MRNVHLRDAKAGLSKLVDAAERGEATVITRHGKPAAIISPVEQAESLPDPVASEDGSFARFLMAFPVDLDEILPAEERPLLHDVERP